MRAAVALAAAALATLALTGCGVKVSFGEGKPTPAPSPTQGAADLRPQVTEGLVPEIREQFPVYADWITAESLMQYADLACELLDGGMSVFDVGAIAVEEGVSPEFAGYLLGYSIASTCPQHEGALDR